MNGSARLFAALGPALTLAAALESPPLAAQIAPPPATPGNGSTPWNSSTTPPPPRAPTADSTLQLQIYRDTNNRDLPPYQSGGSRRNEPGYAVDVSAVMTHCADGSLLITALVIGGQLTPLDNRCPGEPARKPAAPACDANRWNCSTTGSQPAR